MENLNSMTLKIKRQYAMLPLIPSILGELSSPAVDLF